MRRSGKKIKIKIEPEPKLCKIIELSNIISIKHMSIRMEVNFGPKYQLLYYDYHSNGFYKSFHVSNKPDNHFVVFR